MFGPIGLMVAGWGATHLGAHRSLLVCAAVSALSTVLALCSRKVRMLRVPATTR